MIHARQDYNERIQDNANIIPVDEPVFLLRGQDKFAPEILKHYLQLVRDHNTDDQYNEMIFAIKQHIEYMINWQKEVNIKLPDMPEGESIYNI